MKTSRFITSCTVVFLLGAICCSLCCAGNTKENSITMHFRNPKGPKGRTRRPAGNGLACSTKEPSERQRQYASSGGVSRLARERLQQHPACTRNPTCKKTTSVLELVKITQPTYTYDTIFDGSSGKPLKLSPSITIATQLSIDRLDRLHPLLDAWQGDVVAVVWIPNEFQVSPKRAFPMLLCPIPHSCPSGVARRMRIES